MYHFWRPVLADMIEHDVSLKLLYMLMGVAFVSGYPSASAASNLSLSRETRTVDIWGKCIENKVPNKRKMKTSL